MELGKIYKDVKVNEFRVSRNGESFDLHFEFSSDNLTQVVSARGIRETEDLCCLLSAQRIWVEINDSSQLEFGKYTLGISHEWYTEIIFDNLS